MSKKLEKVLEYLINNQEDKARELLHQVFIEKARSIHEELINMDDESLDDLDSDLGDLGKDLESDLTSDTYGNELEDFEDEIETEETFAEADDDIDVMDAETDLDSEMATGDDMDMGADADMDADMDADADMGMDADMDMGADADMDADMDTDADMGMDMDMGGDKMSSIEDTMEKLEDALAELKAEFEAIEAGKAEEGDEDAEEEVEDEAEEDEAEEAEEEEAEEEDEEEMDESWLNEFDDLEESLDLEKVAAPSGDEVGSGKFAKPESSPKSPVGKAPTELMGAKPVAFDKGSKAQGYERPAAPSSQEMKGTANRRKKSTDGMKEVSKEGNSGAMLNKKIGAEGTKSPLSSSPRK